MLTTKMKEIAVVKIQQCPAFVICADNNSSCVSIAKVAYLPFLGLCEWDFVLFALRVAKMSWVLRKYMFVFNF